MRPMEYSEFVSFRPLARVLDAWTRPSGQDPLGPISAGSLKLACTAIFSIDPSGWCLDDRNSDGVVYIGWSKSSGIIFDTEEKVIGPAYFLPIIEHVQDQITGIAVERAPGSISEFR